MSAAAAPPLSTTQIAEALLLDQERRRQLFSYACARFGIESHDAEDLLQETVLELLRCQSCVRRPEGFVFAVFRARCSRFVAAQIAAHGVFSKQEVTSTETLSQPSLQAEERVALREGLDTISAACRKLLRAYYVEGQSLREAAHTVSLAYSSIAKTISRCLRRLRQCLA
jgi:RNA polymerase sigma factor (sigma-70 family)